jgi:hypothetical protein
MNRKLYCVGFTIMPLLALHAQRYDPSTFPLPNHFLPLHTGQQMVVRIPVSLGSLGDAVIESERNTTWACRLWSDWKLPHITVLSMAWSPAPN